MIAEEPNVGKPDAPVQPVPPETPLERHDYALVAFDSEYGNTEKIAHALARGLHETGLSVECVNIKDATIDRLNQYDLLAVGAPTQAFSASPRMKRFLSQLGTVDLSHKSGFAFDTKLKNRFAGNGGGFVEKKLKELGVQIIQTHLSAIVKGKEGPLENGSEEMFEKAGFDIGTHWRKT